MSMSKIGIIADDLTGAGDSGIQFAEKGLETTIIFDIKNIDQNITADEVTVINTDSRGLTLEQAYQKANKAASFLKRSGIVHLYKKIDSTLRGNLGAEIQAVSDVYQPDFVIVAPAFPEMGRTTVNGRQHLHGQPIEETEVSKDPKTPILESNIADLLQQQTQNVAVENLSAAQLGSNLDQWKDKLTECRHNGTKWLVFDAEKDGDLKQITDQLVKTNYRFVWVGSAGLAKFLPEALGLNTQTPQRSFYQNDEPVLVVTGSTSDTTKRQVRKLTAGPDIYGIEVNPLLIFDNEMEKKRQKIAEQAAQHLQNGEDIVLYSGSSAEQKAQVFKVGKQRGYTASEISNKISAQLGSIVEKITGIHPIRNLILTGGDTAMDVCHNLGFAGMKLVKEIEPGIPLGQFIEEPSINVVTKAGGFGSESSLVNAVQCLKRKVVSHEP